MRIVAGEDDDPISAARPLIGLRTPRGPSWQRGFSGSWRSRKDVCADWLWPLNVVKKLSAKKQSQNMKGAILQFSIAMVCPNDNLAVFPKSPA